MAHDNRRTRLVTPRLSPPAPPSLAELGFPERIALFACAMGRETALEVLDGLAQEGRLRARAQASETMAWDSATRQAQLSVVFGLCSDAESRLRELMEGAAPALRRELYRLLPPYHRSLFSAPSPSSEPPPQLVTLVAERLVREAIR